MEGKARAGKGGSRGGERKGQKGEKGRGQKPHPCVGMGSQMVNPALHLCSLYSSSGQR